MDEIRVAADAYYEAKPKELKKAAKMFKKLDKNGDGKVSFEEYAIYYNKKLPRKKRKENKGPKPEHFAELDKEGDGYLDMNEVTVLYYILATRKECEHCGLFIKDMFYSCEKCYNKIDDRYHYNLCGSCYHSKEFQHKHTTFLDCYALLQKDKQDPSSSGAWKMVDLAAAILSAFGGGGGGS